MLPLNRQGELVKLINSVQKENLESSSQTLPKFTGQPRGEFGKDWECDKTGHKVPVTKEYEQTPIIYTAEGVLGMGEE